MSKPKRVCENKNQRPVAEDPVCAKCIDAQGEISALERRVAELKTKLESQPIERFGTEWLSAAEGQLKYYTGLASYKI